MVSELDAITRALSSPPSWPELVWGFRCQVDFVATSSVAAKTTWWVDRLDLSEVKIADCLQRVGEGAVLEVRW